MLPVYVLLILDDYSRYIVGAHIWDGEKAAAVIETFELAVSRIGRPEVVMSDGGRGKLEIHLMGERIWPAAS